MNSTAREPMVDKIIEIVSANKNHLYEIVERK